MCQDTPGLRNSREIREAGEIRETPTLRLNTSMQEGGITYSSSFLEEVEIVIVSMATTRRTEMTASPCLLTNAEEMKSIGPKVRRQRLGFDTQENRSVDVHQESRCHPH